MMAFIASFVAQSLLFIVSTFSTINAQPQRVVTKLIHHNSIFSPFYKETHTTKDFSTDGILKNSNARLAYLQYMGNKNNLASDSGAQQNLVADGSGFFMEFSIGQPPSQQLATMDTGSSFTWVPCKECKYCGKQPSPIFNPSNSSTYETINCSDDTCRAFLEHSTCSSSNKDCMYSITYADQSMATMVRVSTNQLIFEAFDDDEEKTVVLPNMVFGCGLFGIEFENIKAQWNGVFGLGNSPNSIVTKFGNKFSYCIGSTLDRSYSFNRLTFGDGVFLEGYSTPFKKENGLYYVTLQDISFGEEFLNIDPAVFRKNSLGDGVFLDSKSDLTYFPEHVYEFLKSKVSKMLDEFLPRYVDWEDRRALCYNGSIRHDLNDLPAMTFHFANQADLVLDSESLFYHKYPDVVCMTIRPVKITSNNVMEPTIIGIMAQQFYSVAYDLNGGEIYFQRIDCDLLDD